MIASLIILFILSGLSMFNFIAAGISIWEASIVLLMPAALSSVYLYQLSSTRNAVEDYNNSIKILEMTKSVNDGPAFTENMFDELEENLKKLGIELKCDMKEYMK